MLNLEILTLHMLNFANPAQSIHDPLNAVNVCTWYRMLLLLITTENLTNLVENRMNI